jgi:hypothetical protein
MKVTLSTKEWLSLKVFWLKDQAYEKTAMQLWSQRPLHVQGGQQGGGREKNNWKKGYFFMWLKLILTNGLGYNLGNFFHKLNWSLCPMYSYVARCQPKKTFLCSNKFSDSDFRKSVAVCHLLAQRRRQVQNPLSEPGAIVLKNGYWPCHFKTRDRAWPNLPWAQA